MLLARRIGPALTALGIAVSLWLIVRNLDRTPARFTVPVAYEYPEAAVVLVERVPEVEIAVRATKPKLRTLQAAEFVVKIRNTEGRVGREFIVLDADDVDAPFGVEVERVTPPQFVVRYERRAIQLATIAPDVQGRPAAGHAIDPDGIRVRPAEIAVAGPESQLEEPLVVRTERLDVSGRSQDLKARGIALISPGSAFTFTATPTVEVDVPIKPIITRRTFEDVPVEVIDGERNVSPPNPRRLRVTVEGPQLEVEAMPAGALSIVVDASALEPRLQDYQIEPEVQIADGACPSCRVVARSQSRINLSVRAPRGTR